MDACQSSTQPPLFPTAAAAEYVASSPSSCSVVNSFVHAAGDLHVPSLPGFHQVRCPIWRPKGSLGDRIAGAFIGGGAALKDASLVFGSLGADGKGLERPGLATVGVGTVHLLLNVCLRQLPEEARKKPASASAEDE